MEIKVTRFKNGQILIQDTEKMKTIAGDFAEVIVREYQTTKENLFGILQYIEKLEKEDIDITKTEKEQTQEQVEIEKQEENKGEV